MEIIGFDLLYRKKGKLMIKKHRYTLNKPIELDGNTDFQMIYNLNMVKEWEVGDC